MAATLQAYISSHYGHSGLKFSHNVKTATTLSPRARLGFLTSLGARSARATRSPLHALGSARLAPLASLALRARLASRYALASLASLGARSARATRSPLSALASRSSLSALSLRTR